MENKEERYEEIEKIETRDGRIIYKIYLSNFATTLGIEDEKGIWKRNLAKYFRKRTDFPIKRGLGGRAYVLLPEYYVKEMLKKKPPVKLDEYEYLKLTDEQLLKVWHGLCKIEPELANLIDKVKARIEADRIAGRAEPSPEDEEEFE